MGPAGGGGGWSRGLSPPAGQGAGWDPPPNPIRPRGETVAPGRGRRADLSPAAPVPTIQTAEFISGEGDRCLSPNPLSTAPTAGS